MGLGDRLIRIGGRPHIKVRLAAIPQVIPLGSRERAGGIRSQAPKWEITMENHCEAQRHRQSYAALERHFSISRTVPRITGARTIGHSCGRLQECRKVVKALSRHVTRIRWRNPADQYRNQPGLASPADRALLWRDRERR